MDNWRPPTKCKDCYLRRLPAFTPLSTDAVGLIESARITTRRVGDGGLIFRVGETATEAFTLFEGHAIIYRLLVDGRRQIIQFALPGDLMLFPVRPNHNLWTETAEAVGQAVLCVFSAERLRAMFARELPIARAIAEVREADERLLKEHITDLGRRSGIDRVARLYLEIFHREAARGRIENASCRFPFTQEHVGDAVGLSSVHVSRVGAQLRDLGLVALDDHHVRVPDFEKACRHFEYTPLTVPERPLI